MSTSVRNKTRGSSKDRALIMFLLNQPLGRFSLHVVMSVCCTIWRTVFLKALESSFTKVFSQNYQLQKYSLHKRSESNIVLQFWLLNGLKLPHGKNVDFWVFANLPAVHSGGVSREGSVAVAVGVSDM